MERLKRWINLTKFSFAIAVSALTVLVLPVSAEVTSETNCLEPLGDIENLTVRILDGATEDEIVDAFSRLNALSESAVRAAYVAYSDQISEGREPTAISLLVSEMSTCTRLVVI